MPEPELKKVACPTCGAPLLFGPGEITTRCQFCHADVERPLQAGLPAKVKSGPAKQPRARPASQPSPADSPRIFFRLILILTSLVILAVVVMAVLLISMQASRSGSTLSLN